MPPLSRSSNCVVSRAVLSYHSWCLFGRCGYDKRRGFRSRSAPKNWSASGGATPRKIHLLAINRVTESKKCAGCEDKKCQRRLDIVFIEIIWKKEELAINTDVFYWTTNIPILMYIATKNITSTLINIFLENIFDM